MRKIFTLVMSFVSLTTFAQLPEEVAKNATAEQLTQFVVALQPSAKANESQLTTEFQNALDASGQSGAKASASSSSSDYFWTIIATLAGMDTEKLQEYAEKVLPGYLRLVNNRTTPETTDMQFSVDQVFRSPADGAWYGPGDKRNIYRREGLSEMEKLKTVTSGGQIKHSGSYAWGMKTVNNKIYWGDNNNYLCTFGAATANLYFGAGQNNGIVNTPCLECEFTGTSSIYSPYSMGDVYPPHIYVYDPAGEDNQGVVEDIAPHEDATDPAEQEAWKHLLNAQGLRSCGSMNGVIFFGGPGMATRDAKGNIIEISNSARTVSSAFLAYDEDNHKWLGGSEMSSVEMPDGSDSGCRVTDIRRWVIYNGQLYTGVGLTDKNNYVKGAVLRWIGDKEHPFRFVCVGLTDGECGEICFHKGRIYGGGWPVTSENIGTNRAVRKNINSSIYRGPKCPEDGVSVLPAINPNDNTQLWKKVWDYNQYEPSTNTCQFSLTYTSNMISWNGKLYWCMFSPTYTIPMYSMYMFPDVAKDFSKMEEPEPLSYIINNIRGTTLWRVDEDADFDNGGVEMLYGEETLPKVKDGYTERDGEYEMVSNVSGYKPVWGRDGYGNITTAYTWSFMPYRDKLMISTMDYSCLLKNFENVEDSVNSFASVGQMIKLLLQVDDDKMGYECLVLKNNDEAPTYLTEDGFGNHYAYGLRNFSVCQDGNGVEQLIIGTASPMNISDGGGWQIMRVIEDGQEPSAIKAVQVDKQKVNVLMRKNDGYITFSTFDGKNIDNMTVTDISGKIMSTENPAKNVAYVFTQDMPDGVYIVSIKANGSSYTAKFVK